MDSQILVDRKKALVNHYEKLSGNIASDTDIELIELVAKSSVSINDLKDSLTEIFANYRPKHKKCKIRTFSFCFYCLNHKFAIQS